MPELDISAVIAASPQRVLKAFFEPDALHAWWQVKHAVTTPRVLGPYAVAWETTEFRDEVLGRLGGVFRGTVMQFQADRGFFVADAFWLPPDGDPIGPMAFEVACTPAGRTDVVEVFDPAAARTSASPSKATKRASGGAVTTKSSETGGSAPSCRSRRCWKSRKCRSVQS